jgi:hypothetical protein
MSLAFSGRAYVSACVTASAYGWGFYFGNHHIRRVTFVVVIQMKPRFNEIDNGAHIMLPNVKISKKMELVEVENHILIESSRSDHTNFSLGWGYKGGVFAIQPLPYIYNI